MSDHWDFYFSRVNDVLASLMVDLGIRREAPQEQNIPCLLKSVALFGEVIDNVAIQNALMSSLDLLSDPGDATSIRSTCRTERLPRAGQFSHKSRRRLSLWRIDLSTR